MLVMAGNNRGPEGLMSKFVCKCFNRRFDLVLPVENEIGDGTSDLYVADHKISMWIELKSVEWLSDTKIDFSLFTLGQRNFLRQLPYSVGGVLLVEERRTTDPENWLYYSFGKNDLPPVGIKADKGSCRSVILSRQEMISRDYWRHEVYRGGISH